MKPRRLISNGGAFWSNPVFIFIFSALCLIAVCWRSLTERFAFHNDYLLWQYDHTRCCSGFPESDHLVAIGRFLGAYLLNFHFMFLNSMDDFKVSRLISLLMIAASVALFYRGLIRLKVNSWTAFILSLGIFSLPSHQMYILWLTNLVPGALTISLAMVSAALAEQIDFQKLPWKQSLRSRVFLGVVFVLLLTGLFIYPSNVMYFLLPALASLLFHNQLQNWRSLRKNVTGQLLLLGVCCFLYFIIQHFIIAPTVSRTALWGGSYDFALTQDPLEKIGYFVKDLSPAAFNLWVTPPHQAVAWAVAAVILLGLILLIRAKHSVCDAGRVWFWILSILLFINLPCFVPSTTLMGYRLMAPYGSAVALLFFWAMDVIFSAAWEMASALLPKPMLLLSTKSSLPSSGIISFMVLMGLLLGFKNVGNVIDQDESEFSFIKSRIQSQMDHGALRGPTVILVARPRNWQVYSKTPLAYDFRFNATSYAFMYSAIQLAFKEVAGQDRQAQVIPINPEDVPRISKIPPDMMLVDMNALVFDPSLGVSPWGDPHLLTGAPDWFWITQNPGFVFIGAYKTFSVYFSTDSPGDNYVALPTSQGPPNYSSMIQHQYNILYMADTLMAVIASVDKNGGMASNK